MTSKRDKRIIKGKAVRTKTILITSASVSPSSGERDDRAARKRFKAHNPPVELTGTTGLLRELVHDAVTAKPDATAMLELMRRRGGRLPDEGI